MRKLRETEKLVIKFVSFLIVLASIVSIINGDVQGLISWIVILVAVMYAFLYIEHVIFYTSELSTKVKKQ